ncbi:Cytochrome P450 [Mycena venus]|uniref:Cytochrome P450 n=1 Tax=Mycena venus TaxID=2733690 RepID=A0A8H6XY74_9AGAR|nr:Cytochrome P450 [Mycena venus]
MTRLEGPPTVPLLGNLHLLPNPGEMHLKFMEWSKKYGDILSIKIGSSTMVVLSSPTAIKEVVDKSSWAASSRPANYLAGLAAGGYHILFAADTALLRSLRKTIARFFSPSNALHRVPVQAAESTQLLYEIITQPENFSDSIRRVASFTSPKMQSFYQMLHRFLHILLPGVYPPVDLPPVLKYLPERWAPWLAACRRSKSEMAAFHMEHSRAAELNLEDGPLEEYDIFSYTGFTLVEAGSDTSAAYLLSLTLILAVYPEHQERARREIEAVVGIARLPELADFKHMPFVEALIKEVIRIRPIFPIGVPHFTTEDILYKDYVVPKDTTIVLNTYSVFHNPEIFEEPEVFNPERFMKSEHGTRPGMDTDFRDNFLFGAGRRICPGQYVARATMQLTTMRLIWAFSFSSAVDTKTERPIGRELDFYDPEFVVMPYPFKCAIQPRSNEQRDMILSASKDAKFLLQRYEH